MNVYINDKELVKLYETGASRKLKLTSMVIEKFFAIIQKIASADSIHDLWSDKGMNFEKLKGSTNIYSFRITGQYRLEVTVEWKNKEKTIGDFTLLNFSNHYAR